MIGAQTFWNYLFVLLFYLPSFWAIEQMLILFINFKQAAEFQVEKSLDEWFMYTDNVWALLYSLLICYD